MEQYTVKYQAGTYSGEKTVYTDDAEHAISQVKAWVRRTMSIAIYSESYKIV